MSADEDLHTAAFVAALNAALPSASPALALEDIDPNALPDHYVEVTVSRRFGGERRNAGAKGRTGWRASTRVVAKRADNARILRAKVAAAVEDTRLTVAAEQTTPVEFESAEVIGPDDGWFSGLTLWTYSH